MSAFELSGYNLFLIGNKAIKPSNKFDLLKESKGLILTAIAITGSVASAKIKHQVLN
jgi:hypothetical protein